MKWIKKHKTLALIVFLVSVIGTAIIVHVLSPCIKSEITADGMLNYVGTSLATISTLVLAIVAVWQTDRANKQTDEANSISERLLKLEENQYNLEIRPFIMVKRAEAFTANHNYVKLDDTFVHYKIMDYDEKKEVLGLKLILVNTTSSYLIMRLDKLFSINHHELTREKEQMNNAMADCCLGPGEETAIILFAAVDDMKKYVSEGIRFYFDLKNRFSDPYVESFNIDFGWAGVNFYQEEGHSSKWVAKVRASDYGIGKVYYENGCRKINWNI